MENIITFVQFREQKLAIHFKELFDTFFQLKMNHPSLLGNF